MLSPATRPALCCPHRLPCPCHPGLWMRSGWVAGVVVAQPPAGPAGDFSVGLTDYNSRVAGPSIGNSLCSLRAQRRCGVKTWGRTLSWRRYGLARWTADEVAAGWMEPFCSRWAGRAPPSSGGHGATGRGMGSLGPGAGLCRACRGSQSAGLGSRPRSGGGRGLGSRRCLEGRVKGSQKFGDPGPTLGQALRAASEHPTRTPRRCSAVSPRALDRASRCGGVQEGSHGVPRRRA